MKLEILIDEVPAFRPASPHAPDHFGDAGARRAAKACAEAWERAGWQGVRFWVEPIRMGYIGPTWRGGTAHCVRSNLQNGCPPVGAVRVVPAGSEAA